MNDDPRIGIMEGMINNLKSQSDLHYETCMILWGFVVRVTNQHAAMARRFADFPAAFADEDSRCKFLDEVTGIETECQHLEYIFAKGKGPGNEPPPAAPATPDPE